jgi:Zn-finger nucleic acid-binding protein
MTIKSSKETQTQAMKVARGIQKQGQTKEHTKLIAQGIEKGISEYKKLQGKKSRERDKERKQQNKQKQKQANDKFLTEGLNQNSKTHYLPWILLVISWVGFISFLFLK